MNEQKVAISRCASGFLLSGIRNFPQSPVGGMNVAISDVGGYFMSAIEADFRAKLIHTRGEGGEIVSTNPEAGVEQRLNSHIDGLVSNRHRVIAVNRNLNFFTSGYNDLIRLIPVLVVAPMFLDREVEFGVIGQSAMAFATLLGAFSLVITRFQAISSYVSVAARLKEFADYAEKPSSNHLPADP